jgi:lipopolysaccharide transport system ATP-binding protein
VPPSPIIQVESLGKKYRLRHQRQRYIALRDVLTDRTKSAARRLWSALRPRPLTSELRPLTSEDFWALKDVSFEVNQGDVVGIIGRNGAGKSTLLKILSRITEPTEGRVTLEGRVGSLLEVGTGFHPELTGRENVFLNGAILGMSKAEIRKKFDEIVAFAEVEKFLDTPVKHYSSGMYVRLAFAVAAHLEPEILVVDEVLAVGDAEFQKKCLGKMQEVSKGGRTVLFVSHNMTAITRLCGTCLLIDAGAIQARGETASVVSSYLRCRGGNKSEFVPDPNKRPPGNDLVTLLAVSVKGPDGDTGPTFGAELPLQVEILYRVLKPTRDLRIGFRLSSSDGIVVFTTTDMDLSNDGDSSRSRDAGVFVSRCHIPPCFLSRGQYSISVGSDIATVQTNFLCENILSFIMEPVGGQLAWRYDNRMGLVCPDFRWEIQQPQDSCR